MQNFTLKDGRSVWLDWDGDSEMTVWTDEPTRRQVGSVEFFRSEGPEDWDDDTYLVTSLDLERLGGDYVNQGIGREIFRYLVEEEGLMILFSPVDGHRRDDGSHLTGAGVPFARKMIAEGWPIGTASASTTTGTMRTPTSTMRRRTGMPVPDGSGRRSRRVPSPRH